MAPLKAAAVALLLTLTLAGCNTIAGLGRDVSAAGSAVTGTAEDTKEKL